MTACSATQAVPWSKLFETRIRSATSPRSSATERCTKTGTLPGPTARVGFPEE